MTELEGIEADSTCIRQLSPKNENGHNRDPRNDYISWDDYFMGAALLAAKRSKDPKRQVGACIVSPDNIIVGLGYNGMPNGCPDSEFPWGKSSDPYENKLTYVVHAEVNAIVNKNSAAIKGYRMYVTLFPCNECTKVIVQSGIKEIMYLKDVLEDKGKTSKRMLNSANVKYRKLDPSCKYITLDFATC